MRRNSRVYYRGIVAGWCLLAFWAPDAGTALAADRQSQARQVFQGSVSLVPVDVRVLDGQGRPVRDLTKDDFVVLEDGREQEVIAFLRQDMTIGAEAATSVLGPPEIGRQSLLAPQGGRVFLILLGRGRLQHPAMGVDGLIELVSSELLPQDRVGVMAWNRATAFTTGRRETVAVLQRFRQGHSAIETALREQEKTLAAAFGGVVITPKIQAQIDAIFDGPESRTVLPGSIAAEPESTAREARSAVVGNDLLSTTVLPEMPDAFLSDTLVSASAMSFDQYVQRSSQTVFDMKSLYAAVSYLRLVEGEKQIIFVSERGMFFPSTTEGRGIAGMAADGRIVINTIHTGGLEEFQAGHLVTPSTPASDGRLRSVADETRAMAARVNQSPYFMARTLRDLADATGGIASAYRMASDAVRRVEASTRTWYVLGYRSAAAADDGRFRRIEVRVKRPGVRVTARSGYFPGEKVHPVDRKAFLTYSRIATAGGLHVDVPDLPIQVDSIRLDGAGERLTVRIGLDGSKLSFTRDADLRIVTVDVAVFCGNDDEELVGELWQEVPIRLSEEDFRRLGREFMSFELEVGVSSRPRFVKVVAYDYQSDQVGSKTVVLR